MKQSHVIAILAALLAVQLVMSGTQLARATQLGGMERAPIFASGAPGVIHSTTSASDYSAELEVPSNYFLYCPTASYCQWGDTAIAATTASLPIAAGMYFPFATNGGADPIKYVACINATTSGSCLVIEAR